MTLFKYEENEEDLFSEKYIISQYEIIYLDLDIDILWHLDIPTSLPIQSIDEYDICQYFGIFNDYDWNQELKNAEGLCQSQNLKCKTCVKTFEVLGEDQCIECSSSFRESPPKCFCKVEYEEYDPIQSNCKKIQDNQGNNSGQTNNTTNTDQSTSDDDDENNQLDLSLTLILIISGSCLFIVILIVFSCIYCKRLKYKNNKTPLNKKDTDNKKQNIKDITNDSRQEKYLQKSANDISNNGQSSVSELKISHDSLIEIHLTKQSKQLCLNKNKQKKKKYAQQVPSTRESNYGESKSDPIHFSNLQIQENYDYSNNIQDCLSQNSPINIASEKENYYSKQSFKSHNNNNFDTQKHSKFDFSNVSSNKSGIQITELYKFCPSIMEKQTLNINKKQLNNYTSNESNFIINIKDEIQFKKNFDTESNDIVKIGEGGFGSVYKARSNINQNFYAIKQMQAQNQEMAQLLEREIKIYQKIQKSHDNIMSILDYYSWEKKEGLQKTKTYILVLPLAHCSLSDEIEKRYKNKKLFTDKQIFSIMYQCVQAMNHLRFQGIYHRDIKPQNILLMEQLKEEQSTFNVKLTDYGISKDILNSSAAYNHTISYVQGSLLYMSPELKNMAVQQEQQKYQCDYILSDIFSLGLTMIQVSNLLPAPKLIGLNDYLNGEQKIKNILETISNSKLKEILEKVLKFDPLERPSIEHLILMLRQHI